MRAATIPGRATPKCVDFDPFFSDFDRVNLMNTRISRTDLKFELVFCQVTGALSNGFN